MKNKDATIISDSNVAPTEPGSIGEQRFLKIAARAGAPGFGFSVALLQALVMNNGGLGVRVSLWTLVAFVIGTFVAHEYWKLARGYFHASREKALFIASVVTLWGVYLYPLRFMPRDKLPEIFIGLASALAVLSLAGVAFWRIFRFLNADADRTEALERTQSARWAARTNPP